MVDAVDLNSFDQVVQAVNTIRTARPLKTLLKKKQDAEYTSPVHKMQDLERTVHSGWIVGDDSRESLMSVLVSLVETTDTPTSHAICMAQLYDEPTSDDLHRQASICDAALQYYDIISTVLSIADLTREAAERVYVHRGTHPRIDSHRVRAAIVRDLVLQLHGLSIPCIVPIPRGGLVDRFDCTSLAMAVRQTVMTTSPMWVVFSIFARSRFGSLPGDILCRIMRLACGTRENLLHRIIDTPTAATTSEVRRTCRTNLPECMAIVVIFSTIYTRRRLMAICDDLHRKFRVTRRIERCLARSSPSANMTPSSLANVIPPLMPILNTLLVCDVATFAFLRRNRDRLAERSLKLRYVTSRSECDLALHADIVCTNFNSVASLQRLAFRRCIVVDPRMQHMNDIALLRCQSMWIYRNMILHHYISPIMPIEDARILGMTQSPSIGELDQRVVVA